MFREIISIFESFNEKSNCKRKTVHCCWLNSAERSPVWTNFSIGECSGEKGNCGCVHAEVQCILGLCHRTDHVALLCEYSPCSQCANLIILSNRVSVVVYRYLTEHDKRGVEKLLGNNISVFTLDQVKESVRELDHYASRPNPRETPLADQLYAALEKVS